MMPYKKIIVKLKNINSYNMPIISHTINNYTGRLLNIYKKHDDYRSILNSNENFKIRNINPNFFLWYWNR